MCPAAQEAGAQHHEYIDRKKTRFSHLCSSVLPLRNKTIFAVDTPANFSTPHTKFEQNRFKRSLDMRLQTLA